MVPIVIVYHPSIGGYDTAYVDVGQPLGQPSRLLDSVILRHPMGGVELIGVE